MDNFLTDLSADGRFDSAGEFTIGWEEARRKLERFQAGELEAFLLYFVSAGCAMGARNVAILEDDQSIEVTMYDCYIAREDLRDGFYDITRRNGPSHLLDLAMGLNGGLQGRRTEVRLEVSHPELPSYRWRLTGESESSTPLTGGNRIKMVKATFGCSLVERITSKSFWKSLLGGTGGYVGMSRACRIVDERCDHSDVPITVNRQMCNRPVFLPPCRVGCVVGAPRTARVQTHTTVTLESELLRGAFVLEPGNVVFVVNGLSYPGISHSDISGVAWTQLPRDLGRTRLLTAEPDFQAVWSEIEQIALKMDEADA